MPGTPAGRSVDVLCPFYRKDKNRTIYCEGITHDSFLHLAFSNKRGFDMQMDIFCCDHYKNCEIYEAVMKAKYAEEMD